MRLAALGVVLVVVIVVAWVIARARRRRDQRGFDVLPRKDD